MASNKDDTSGQVSDPEKLMGEMSDPQALERGISNLDKIMAHFRQKVEDAEKRIQLDTEDLKWVEREIEHSEPKLKALEEEHARKLKDRDILAEEIQSSVERIQTMMKNSTNLVKNARMRDRALQKADASYKLSVSRGFETKTSTIEYIAGKKK